MLNSVLSGIALITAAGVALADADAPQAPEPETRGLAEIVVTANRREESLQRSALAIEAVSGAELARSGVTNPEALNDVTTGVMVGTGASNQAQVYIRGVGNYGTNMFSESAIALNVDDVYVSRSWATRGSYFDLQRVEVLKGPQGTLYGRNASGGTINLISVRPTLGQTTGFFEIEGGDYSLVHGTGAVNLPIGDKVAIRAAGQVIDRKGYLDDGYDDDKTQAARIHALIQPIEMLSVLLTGTYSHGNGKGPGYTMTSGYGNNAWRGPTYPLVTQITAANVNPPGVVPGPGGALVPFIEFPHNDAYLESTVYGISGELNWTFGPATLTVIPAYRDGRNEYRLYVPNYQINAWESDHQTSFEARLANQSDVLKWVLGAFYFDETQRNPSGRHQEVDNGNFTGEVRDQYRAGTTSYAAFGEGTFSVTQPFRLTAGIRYTHEHKTEAGNSASYSAPNPPTFQCNPGSVIDPSTLIPLAPCLHAFPVSGDVSFNNVTWKAGAEYDVAAHSMAYATVTTGFKSGGFFPAPAPHNSFKPEKLTAYELGIKNRFLDNRLQLNGELFYWLYRDHQESHLGPTDDPAFYTFITENAGKAKSYGASIDLELQATTADRIRLRTQYNKAYYTTFNYNTPNFFPPVTGCGVTQAALGAPFSVNCAGWQMARAPTWSGNAGYEHTFTFADGSSLTAGGRIQYASSYYLTIDFLQSGRQAAFQMYDADLTFTSANEKWSVTAWGRNLSNEAVFTQAFRGPFITPGNPLINNDGLIAGTLRPPRTFGLRARFGF